MTSEYVPQPDLGSLSTPSEPLQTILDSPGNLDWVSRAFTILTLQNGTPAAQYSSAVHKLMIFV